MEAPNSNRTRDDAYSIRLALKNAGLLAAGAARVPDREELAMVIHGSYDHVCGDSDDCRNIATRVLDFLGYPESVETK